MGAPFPNPDLDSAEAIRADLDALLAEAGRARFLRRQLEAALDHGTAMLAALDLPQLDALDTAIAALDALDGDPEAEDEWNDEDGTDDELSLGWCEAVSQADLGHAKDDAEPTLGAPERSPWAYPLSGPWYKPARGVRLARCFKTQVWNQVAWAQGSCQDGEGESEAGYDLPEGDDETCGSEHDGREPDGGDQDIGSAAGDGNQEHWAQGDGRDYEDVNEDGGDEGREMALRPLSPRRPDPMGFRLAEERRAISRRARDMKARLHPETRRDPDTLTIFRNGQAYWSGPYVTRDGVPVVGRATA